MVQQSDVLKQFLAGTYSNQILQLNSVSESEKTEDFKNLDFPKNKTIIPPVNIAFKIFKYKVVVYNFFLLRGNHYHSLSHAKQYIEPSKIC